MRHPIYLRSLLLFLALFLLLLADMLCYQQGLPIELDEQGGSATLHVGSQVLPLEGIGTLISLQFAQQDPVVQTEVR